MHLATHSSPLRTIRGACLALGFVLGGLTRCGAATQTTTTTFQYNADGAPTAITTQVDSQPAATTFLTWDNFTPNATTPSTGTVSVADGNLLGVGTSPGATGQTTQFMFDARDRLTACSTAGQSSVSYAYYPTSQMASSTLASGDALQFYYNTGAMPLMINTRQPSTGLTASFLGPVRYLSDGTEQALLQPRKDVAGVYTAAAQTLSPYSYAPYGTPLSASASAGLSGDGSSYDLSQNPFQYAGEYQDPTCSTYYLRARWYLPAQQTFLSRDPADPLHRYSYGGGNPIGRTDPSGLKFTGADFSRDVDKAVHKLTPGILGYIEPLLPVWGQALGGVELLGLLPSFWHHPTAAGWVDFSFLSASILAEVGGETPAFDELFATPQRAFGTRIGIDLALGASQTAAQSVHHGRVDVPPLIEGIDTTLFGIFWSRIGAGIGYRPFGLSVDDLDAISETHFRNPDNINKALVFRVRFGGSTTPWMEDLHLGNYHEAVLALTQDSVWRAEVGLGDVGGTYTWQTKWSREAADLNEPSRLLAGRSEKQLIFAGTFSGDAVETAFRTELSQEQQGALATTLRGMVRSDMPEYTKYYNNCQRNAARIRANIITFQNAPINRVSDVSDLND